MRASIERLTRCWWAGDLGWGGTALRAAAAPLSWAWAGASRLRSGGARRGGTERVPGLFVVSVGNLAVGGTGKTPVSAWAARRLGDSGLPVGVLVGGAGADEALLHGRWNPDVRVFSGRDRVASAEEAATAGLRAVVLDDGFQHVRLQRDLDVVLLSADDPFPAPVLPCGPYRERPDALARADAVVITRRSATPDDARVLEHMARRFAPSAVSAGGHLAPAGLRTLEGFARVRVGAGGGGAAPPGTVDPKELGAVLAVCGIARAGAFADAVARTGVGSVELHAFADHHRYGEGDVARMLSRARGRPIVVTAKDAVKLERFGRALERVLVLIDELRWDWGEGELGALLGGRATEALR